MDSTSTLVKANVSGYWLAPSGMTVAEFKEHAIRSELPKGVQQVVQGWIAGQLFS